MRISDWSSDVCSSDLAPARLIPAARRAGAGDRLRIDPTHGPTSPALPHRGCTAGTIVQTLAFIASGRTFKGAAFMIKVHWLAQAFFAAFLAMSVAACTASSPTSESAGQYVDSAAITTKVKAALAKDPQVSAMQVNVETFKDVVQLSGFVNTPTAKERAEAITRKVEGVKDGENDIVVKPKAGSKPKDRESVV